MNDLSLKERIIIHINYRDVFNAPIKKDDLIKWIIENRDIEKLQEIELVLKELKNDGLIIERKGFLAVAGKEEIIDLQNEKTALTQHLIHKGTSFLRLLGKLPFIKFIGISGSVAANNPTVDNEGHVDLDLFIITSKNTLWIIFLIERLVTNITRLIRKKNFYCFNYVVDESFLEIYNKNFFTATEMINLIPVLNKGVQNKFVEHNSWFKSFYPEKSILYDNESPNKKQRSYTYLKPLNHLCFAIFCLFRALKWFSFRHILEYSSKFNSKNRFNLKRISVPNGGYQELIKDRFKSLLNANFPTYSSERFVEVLFPEKDSFLFLTNENRDDLVFLQNFKRYQSIGHEKSSI